jgi:hypothetical protein
VEGSGLSADRCLPAGLRDRPTPSPLLSSLPGPSNRERCRRVGRGLRGRRLHFSAPLSPPTLMGKAATSPPPPRRLRGVDAQRVEHGDGVRCLPPPCRDASVDTLALRSLDGMRSRSGVRWTGRDVIRVPCICVRVPIWLLSLLGFGSVGAFGSMFESRLASGFLIYCGIGVFELLLA